MELSTPPAARNFPSDESAREVISVVLFVPFLLLIELRGSCAMIRCVDMSPERKNGFLLVEEKVLATKTNPDIIIAKNANEISMK